MKSLNEEIQFAVNIFKSGDFSKSEKLSKKLIDSNPNVAFLYNLMGLIKSKQNDFDKAKEYYEKGLKIDPKFAMIYNNLGLLLSNKRQETDTLPAGYEPANFKEAEKLYKKSISLDSKIAEPHVNLGSLYSSLDNYGEAEKEYKKALDINSNFVYAHHNLASMYINLGKFDFAIKHLKITIKIDPNFFSAHRSLSRIIKYTESEDHLKVLLKAYKNIKQGDKDGKMNLCFSLGKAYDDIKNYDKSFIFFEEANSLYRKTINFLIEDEIKRFSEIKKTFDEKIFKKYKNSGCRSSKPIFILGMPRSGTTLVEQIISNHGSVYGGDELEFIPSLINKNFGSNNLSVFFEGGVDFDESIFNSIGEEYIAKIDSISKNSKRITDKLPINFLWIGFIKLILPNSKIVHCYRNPKDNIISIFTNHFPSGKITFAYDLNETIEYYNLYTNLMNYWNNILPNFIYNIKYENLISETDAEIERLLEFCDLDWSNKCLEFYNNKRPIKTASNAQARKKIYNSSIDSWKKYEKFLIEKFKKLQS